MQRLDFRSANLVTASSANLQATGKQESHKDRADAGHSSLIQSNYIKKSTAGTQRTPIKPSEGTPAQLRINPLLSHTGDRVKAGGQAHESNRQYG